MTKFFLAFILILVTVGCEKSAAEQRYEADLNKKKIDQLEKMIYAVQSETHEIAVATEEKIAKIQTGMQENFETAQAEIRELEMLQDEAAPSTAEGQPKIEDPTHVA